METPLSARIRCLTMTAPRILMFCEQFHPRVGGAERQAQKLARALMDLGCNVEVLTPRHNPSWQSTEDVDGVRIHRFPYVDISSRVRGIRGLGVPNAAFGFWQVRRALHALMGRFDVLHGHIASPMVVYAMDCAHAAGRRAICKIAASGPRWDLEVLRRTSLAGGWLARHALARFDMWIAVSEGIRRQLEESGVEASRIRSIPNGVLVPKVEPGAEPAPARKFLYLGRLSATAGRDVPTLLRAFDQLARDLPDCELCLVGGGEHQGEIRELLASLPDAGKRTRMVGFEPPGPWLEWADVVVQPSLAEGMSNTILEAMAAGTCCIANDIPPNREVLANGKAGILVSVGNVEALAAAMREMAVTPGMPQLWGQRGRIRALEVYSMEKVASQYLSLYTDLLRAGPC